MLCFKIIPVSLSAFRNIIIMITWLTIDMLCATQYNSIHLFFSLGPVFMSNKKNFNRIKSQVAPATTQTHIPHIIIDMESSSASSSSYATSNLIFFPFSPGCCCCSNLRFICSAFRVCTSMCLTR